MCASIDRGALEDQTRLGRLLTKVENDPLAARELLAALPAPANGAHRIGLTGSPGVGKSTLLRGLIHHYREAGHRVGVVAVDPTSPFTGGAILGDRVRLSELQADPGVFIRSLGSRGSLGGVAPGASAVAGVLEAAGYSRVLIETVGVGQTGYDVICLADTVVALFSPEGGDAVQLLKAGMLEVGDIFVVNKGDRPGADLMLKEINFSIELAAVHASELLHHGVGNLVADTADGTPPVPATGFAAAWVPPALRAIAREQVGISELAAAIDAHMQWLANLPADHPRRRQRQVRELGFVMRTRLNQLLDQLLVGQLDTLARQVQAGEIDLWSAIEQLRKLLREKL